MTAVLVTGSAGFLGKAVCAALLARAIKTIGVDPQANGNASHPSFADDLSNRNRIAEYLAYYGITHIIHCGGVSGPRLASAERMVADNTGGTMNLALAAAAAAVQRFVFASSIAACDPRTAYGRSKAAAELVLQALHESNPGRFCTLRFAGIYGPGRKRPMLLHDLVAAALSGTAISVPARAEYVLVHIEDAAAGAIQACLAKTTDPRPYPIAHPARVTALALAQSVQGFLPSFRFDVSSAVEGAMAPPFEIAAAQRDFGFAPGIDYKIGIGRLICWMSSHAQTP